MPDKRQPEAAETRERIDGYLFRSGLSTRSPRVVPLTGDASDRRYFRVLTPAPPSIVLSLHAGPFQFDALPFVNVSRLLAQMPVPIPTTATGPLQLQVIDGSTLAQLEGRRRSLEQARSVDELVKLLNAARRGDRWYVRLMRPAAGSVVNGRDLPALPGTVMNVLGASPGVVSTSLDQEVLGEWELPADAVATGQRTIALAPLVP